MKVCDIFLQFSQNQLQYLINIIMICSQKRLHELAAEKKLPCKHRQQLIELMRNGGYDMPDCMFENAYQAYKADNSSDQKYIQLEEILYSGLSLKVETSTLKRFLIHMKNKIGENTYIRRINKFINFTNDPQADPQVMQDLLREDLSDTETMKKSLTASKRLGRMNDYIRELNNYLEVEPLDEEVWLELAMLYAENGNYNKASFCFEELVVLNPSNEAYNIKLAEMYITVGGKTNIELAIKYLSYLITKRPDNTRALWMIYRVVCEDKEQSELKQICGDALNKLYSKKNPSLKIHLAL